MEILNYTPHPIVVQLEDYLPLIFNSIGSSRVNMSRTDLSSIKLDTIEDQPNLRIPSATLEPICIIGLPEPADGTLYIVSSMVLDVAKKIGRTDCIAPDTDWAIRNEQGHIVSVPGFIQ